MRRVLSVFTLLGVFALGCSTSEASKPTSGAVSSTTPGSSATGANKGAPPDTDPTPDTETATGAVTTPPSTAACVGDPSTFYGLTITKLDSTSTIPFCGLKGNVVLIVNGASGCGYTPQYKPLEAMYTKYNGTQKLPFQIVAFPSKSFNQEKDTDAEVSEFCTTEYAITFPLATINPVINDATKTPATAQPVYQWLYAQPGMSTPVAWNFEKFLISKDGKVVKRWLTAVSPDEGSDIDLAVAAELAK
jgi:glutathione peroxidase